MAENHGTCLLGIMDRLWFHHIVLIPEHHSLSFSETCEEMSESFACSTTNKSQTTLIMPEKQISSAADDLTPQQDEGNSQVSEIKSTSKGRPTRLNLLGSKTRSHSSSPCVQKRCKLMRLQKTMSCKDLWELEIEEVKGFMDLGFKFNKQHMTKRLMRVIPGLQRLQEFNKEENNNNKGTEEDEAEEVEENNGDDDAKDDDIEEKRRIIRPYLSEAWLIKKPDSPLLNLRVPRASAAADMKKHLKYWARTVASVIHQES